MSTNSKSEEPQEKSREDSNEDLATFEELPEDTKNQLNLKEKVERTSGPEQVEITEKIEENDDQASKS